MRKEEKPPVVQWFQTEVRFAKKQRATSIKPEPHFSGFQPANSGRHHPILAASVHLSLSFPAGFGRGHRPLESDFLPNSTGLDAPGTIVVVL